MPGLDDPGDGQAGQDQGQQHHRALRDPQEVALGDPVGDHTAIEHKEP
jgi:hypothetical protein